MSSSYRTSSGIDVPAVIPPAEPRTLPAPGQYPFTRGIYPDMYRGRLWTMRQYAGFGSARETNHRFRYLLAQGQTGLSVAFDLATQIGYDSDHPMARGEVGRTGVAIDSLADMEVLFDQIPLASVSTSMTINATAMILYCLYLAVGKKQGVPLVELRGTIQNDILKEFIARGTYIYPPKASMRLITDIFTYAANATPKFNTISISGYHIREAGATAAQEVAFTLSNAIAYVEAAVAAGLAIDDFAPRLSFFFVAYNDLFEEVAKYRAARRIWATLMKERFGAKSAAARMLRFHTQTGGSTLTAQQPENNIVRTTVQAMAAVLGGTQSLHTNSFDEALALPTEHSAEIALRTQQILAHESGVTATADPLAGSYYVEWLTDQLEGKIQEIMATIADRGGAVGCVENGYFKAEIAREAYEYQRRIEHQEQIVVGLNRFVRTDETPSKILRIDDQLERDQIAAVKSMRDQRDQRRTTTALERLRQAATTDVVLVPYVLDAVEAYATVGEISDVFRACWGEYRDAR